MRHNILVALGIAATITGLASSAHAQSALLSNSEAGNFTSSDDSLVEIEGRSLTDDYETFFGEEENSSDISLNNDGVNILNTEPRQGVEINEKVEVLVNEEFAPEINPIFSREAEEYEGLERVEVQYELTE